jgi:hypothetical protein
MPRRRDPIPGLGTDAERVVNEATGSLDARVAKLERKAGRGDVVIADTSAKVGEFLNIEAPAAGLTILFPRPTAALRNERITLSFRNANPVRLVCVDGQVNRLPFVISSAVGTFECICDGQLGWATQTGLSSSGSPTNAQYILGAAHGSLPNASVATDSTEIDVTATAGSTASWALRVASVVLAKLQDLTGLSVLGRAANSAGVMAAITATAGRQVLRANDAGTALQWGNPIDVQDDNVLQGAVHTLDFTSTTSIIAGASVASGEATVTMQRAAITGAVTASQNDNATVFGAAASGAGLTGGGTATLDVGAGTHITVNANDVAVNLTTLVPAIDSPSVVADGTVLERAALTGAISAAQDSNATLFAGIKDNGSAENDRTNLNFVSSGDILLSVTDDAANDELEISATMAPLVITTEATGGTFTDYALPSNTDIWSFTATSTISSVAGGVADRRLIIRNAAAAGSGVTVTVQQFTGGTAANRFLLPKSVQHVLHPGDALESMYISSRWCGLDANRPLYRTNSSGLGASRGRVNFVNSTSVTWSNTDDSTDDEVEVSPQRAALSGAIAATANSNATLFSGIRVGGAATTDRTNINLIAGSNVTITPTDDAVNDEIELTIAASGTTINGMTVKWGGGVIVYPNVHTIDFINGDGITPTTTESPSGEINLEYNVDVSDFAGTGLEDDGSENLRIAASAAGNGLTGGAGSALAVGAGDGITVNANDVAVNATAIAGSGLENDGSNNLRTIGALPLDHRYIAMVEEFLSCSEAASIGATPVPIWCDTGWWFSASGGATSAIAYTAGLDQHPGIATMTTPATANIGCFLTKGEGATAPIMSGTTDLMFDAIVRFGTSTDVGFRIGLSSTFDSAAGQHFYFESDTTVSAGAIHCYYASGVGRTSAGSTAAPSTNWVRLSATRVSSTLTWYVNGTQIATFGGVGVPAGAMNFGAFVYARSANARTLLVDRLGLFMGAFGSRV